MKIKPEITITILFTIFVILLFGHEYIGFESFDIMIYYLILIIPFLLLIYLAIKLLKIPKNEFINYFKNLNIITKILLIITIISVVYELIIAQTTTWSSIPFLLLVFALMGEWLKK